MLDGIRARLSAVAVDHLGDGLAQRTLVADQGSVLFLLFAVGVGRLALAVDVHAGLRRRSHL